MSQHGAALQTYNQELVKCEFERDLEDMKQKRAELQKQIDLEEEEKQNLEREMKNLTNKLLLVNDRLGKKKNVHNEYDRIIAETEASFTKILESSQLLLSMIKKEASKLHENMVKVSIDKQHRRQ